MSYGGQPITQANPLAPPHEHKCGGQIPFPYTSIALASGCCADGYGQSGLFPLNAGCTTQDDASHGSINFPYLMVPFCKQAAMPSNDDNNAAHTFLRQ
jgi:hypothetical protein